MTSKLQAIILVVFAVAIFFAGYYVRGPEIIRGDIEYVEVSVPVDSSAIISAAIEGLEPVVITTEDTTLIGRARRQVAQLQAIIDSLGQFNQVSIPSISADTTVTWSGVDEKTSAKWSVSVRDSLVVIPLLGEVRQHFSLDLDLEFNGVDTLVIREDIFPTMKDLLYIAGGTGIVMYILGSKR